MNAADTPDPDTSAPDTSSLKPSPRLALIFLLLTAPIPTLGTSLAMVWLPEAVWPKVVFFLAKIWLFAAPVFWLIKVEKVKFSWACVPRWHQRGMLAAHASGIFIFIAILIAYLTVGQAWIEPEPMLEKIRAMKLDNVWLYAAGALYWCTVNSMLEEYFWRWFIFRRLCDLLSERRWVWAALISGVLFTAHHVVALKVYFNWPMALLASAGVFIGGFTWSLLYARWGNIYGAYVSHVYADIVIFGIGAWIIFG